ncbi:hypothetical protein MTO96_037829 [Rhipicephalus appendiculatus]
MISMGNTIPRIILACMSVGISGASPKSNIAKYERKVQFTIEMFYLSDTVLTKRLDEAGIRFEQYVEEYVQRISEILSQLEPAGSVTLLGTQKIESKDEDKLLVLDGENVMCTETLAKLLNYGMERPNMWPADTLVLATGRTILCGSRKDNRKIVKGASLPKGMCGNQKGIVVSDKDDGYASHLTAAHEIGHALGSPHDGTDTSRDCPASEKHLMTIKAYQDRKSTFSHCSVKAISEFLKTPQAKCLFEKAKRPSWCAATRNDSLSKEERLVLCERQMQHGDYVMYTKLSPNNCKVFCITASLNTNIATDTYWINVEDGANCDEPNTPKKCIKGNCVQETASIQDGIIED